MQYPSAQVFNGGFAAMPCYPDNIQAKILPGENRKSFRVIPVLFISPFSFRT